MKKIKGLRPWAFKKVQSKATRYCKKAFKQKNVWNKSRRGFL